MIDLKQAVDYLLENDYLVVVENKLTITNKLHREFKPIPREVAAQLFPDSNNLFPNKKAIWDKFIKDAMIPHQAEGTDGKKYTLRQYTDGIAADLIRIIKQVDYRVFVESTKRYYNTPSFKLTFKNYLQRDVWKQEYQRYEEGLRTNSLAYGQGGNSWET